MANSGQGKGFSPGNFIFPAVQPGQWRSDLKEKEGTMLNPKKLLIAFLLAASGLALYGQEIALQVRIQGQSLAIYPQTLERAPAVPSPCRADDGTEWVTARTRDGRYALVEVTVPDWSRTEVKYFGDNILTVDRVDFPSLARTGLHALEELERTRSINGRPLAEITELARPGRLSHSGFLAEDEDIISVLSGDDLRVRKLGLSHPQLARPLLHMWNVILLEQKHGRGVWGKGHVWVHFDHFLYNGRKISYEAHFTKGGQKSPFADGIEGGAHVFLKREMEPAESEFLKNHYPRLSPEKFATLERRLTALTTGELEPFYIVRYGFYEGHSAWRTDPIAIASVFGLRSLAELEKVFPGQLDEVLTAHFSKNK
jgi:hypothetical protein